jgi:hypothetical protein
VATALTETAEQGRIPVPSGDSYRVASPARSVLVTPLLAAEIERVLERFATEAGFSAQQPVAIVFKPGVVGHHRVGRAADIYAVGGRGLDAWKADWDLAEQRDDTEGERRRNLGWRLYKAIQAYGRWSQPPGYPIQLFGPWTRSEGPWRRISSGLLFAHRDHIHVAK